ncbi:DUF1648 domain-containing protein [Planococcus salinus]|uniref:DUF1648 domain-containing protein n=1 Tax=Planococcus salinus TaxID=1848460 RepID=A0A3M8P4V4_9BACL|nr:DUF1648 domain-containing protein [Planococcus salinus]RNF38718.1 DUF1648 domain-containing protein [Planococcus salinus]
MNLKKQPVFKIEKTFLERLFDWIGIFSFLAATIFLIIEWPSIPETVPMHFDASGEADGWGPRWTIFLLLAVGLALWIGLYFLEKVPHVHNYLNLTEQNVRQQYKNSQLLLNVLKNEILVFFSYFTWSSVQIAKGQADSLGTWALPVFLVIIFGSLGFFMIRSLRL